ncbi:MAG: ABC transporter permease, partial [Dehalococcoidales bacterium]|nr:ABC transporter permease [Dehalococcoidales bacterium]
MKYIEFFGIAIKSLLSNKLRSALTMLGMIIGVGAVITLMSLGQGLQNMITSTFEDIGANLLFVQPSNPEAPGFASIAPSYATASLTMDDAEAISRIRSVTAVSPTNENFVKIVAGSKDTIAVIEGSTPEFQQLYGFTMASGQFISEVNLARRDTVIVIGSKVAEELFGSDDPIGQTVRLKDKRFTVIGVLAPRGMSAFGMSWDELVVTPITTFQARLFSSKTPSGEDAVQSIVVQLASADVKDEVTADIEA